MEKGAVYLTLLGGTGHGKSSTGNSILMRKYDFETGNTAESVTMDAEMKSTVIDGHMVHVVDNPGIPATNVRHVPEGERMKEFVKELEDGMALCPKGVDCFLFVLNFASPRFTEEQMSTFKILEDIFSKEMFAKFCVVIFTHKDAVDTYDLVFNDWCRKQGGGLGRLLKLCRYRCLLFDNRNPTECQRKKLLQMVLDMKPQGLRYNNKLFSRAIKARQQLIEREKFQIIQIDVYRNLEMLKRKLRDILETKRENNALPLLLELDEIEDNAGDLLAEIYSYENTSGVYDASIFDIKDTIKEIKRNIRKAESAAKQADLDLGMFQNVSFISSAAASLPMGGAMTLLGVSNPVAMSVTTLGTTVVPGIVKLVSKWKENKANRLEKERNATREEARRKRKTRILLSKL